MGEAIRRFDALVCVSDPVAFGTLSACRRLWLNVPGDIAITRFGQFKVAMVSGPRITTVGGGARRIGEDVAAMLDSLFLGDPVPARIDIGAGPVLGGTS